VGAISPGVGPRRDVMNKSHWKIDCWVGLRDEWRSQLLLRSPELERP
jgi:hypothetical protein